MIEIPESIVWSRQMTETLSGKKISDVMNATNLHRFTWFNGDPRRYPEILIGRTVREVKGYGSFLDILLDGNVHLVVHDGVNLRYNSETEKCPSKFQLLIIFDDGSYLVFSVVMYGGIYAFSNDLDNSYYKGSMEKLSPLDDRFDLEYFHRMINITGKNLSVKALLATEQRIPGLGNGVLQDILYNAGINPKLKLDKLSDQEIQELFSSIKSTLSEMISYGGRDTEKDIFGKNGGYRCKLSKNTYHELCPHCDSRIIKEAYMGGSVYYCPLCQSVDK
jgi:formamidopyrimidine-DNA glycosylase